jgi:hypothetical protein
MVSSLLEVLNWWWWICKFVARKSVAHEDEMTGGQGPGGVGLKSIGGWFNSTTLGYDMQFIW